jgi:hypothetical protein
MTEWPTAAAAHIRVKGVNTCARLRRPGGRGMIRTLHQLDGTISELMAAHPLVSSRILAKSIVAQVGKPNDLLVVIPASEVVLPTNTMIQHWYCCDVTHYERDVNGEIVSVPEYEVPLWNEDEIMAARPSDDHYLVWAAVWVPGRVLDAS